MLDCSSSVFFVTWTCDSLPPCFHMRGAADRFAFWGFLAVPSPFWGGRCGPYISHLDVLVCQFNLCGLFLPSRPRLFFLFALCLTSPLWCYDLPLLWAGGPYASRLSVSTTRNCTIGAYPRTINLVAQRCYSIHSGMSDEGSMLSSAVGRRPSVAECGSSQDLY